MAQAPAPGPYLWGRSILSWIVTILVAICVFLLAKWLIPLLFGLVGVAIPDQIVTVIALLLVIGVIVYPFRIG